MEKLKILKNGNLIELSEEESQKLLSDISKQNKKEVSKNAPLDRTLIKEKTKKELKEMIFEYPKTRVLAEILLGSDEVSKLLGE